VPEEVQVRLAHAVSIPSVYDRPDPVSPGEHPDRLDRGRGEEGGDLDGAQVLRRDPAGDELRAGG